MHYSIAVSSNSPLAQVLPVEYFDKTGVKFNIVFRKGKDVKLRVLFGMDKGGVHVLGLFNDKTEQSIGIW